METECRILQFFFFLRDYESLSSVVAKIIIDYLNFS